MRKEITQVLLKTDAVTLLYIALRLQRAIAPPLRDVLRPDVELLRRAGVEAGRKAVLARVTVQVLRGAAALYRRWCVL